MKISVVSLIFFSVLGHTVTGTLASFCYNRESCSPSSAAWGGQCQVGKSQSPVDIPVPKSSGIVKRNLVANGFDSQRLALVNIGQTVKLVIMPESKPGFIYGSLFSGWRYILREVHFHWGSTDLQGSEHTLSGKRFPIEAHFVHYNSDFEDITTAVASAQRNALAVIGVIFEADEHDNPALDPIINALPNVRDEGSFEEIGEMDLLSVFPKAYLHQSHKARFATVVQYNGSLTVPTCNEIVLWNVLYTPSFISKQQLKQFRLLKDTIGEPLVDTFRPLQALNNREFSPATVVIGTENGQKKSEDTEKFPPYFPLFPGQGYNPYLHELPEDTYHYYR